MNKTKTYVFSSMQHEKLYDNITSFNILGAERKMPEEPKSSPPSQPPKNIQPIS